MKSITYDHAENRPLAAYMRAIISWNPRSAIDRRLVGKVVTVVARHTTEPDSLWRVSLFNPVQGIQFVDLHPADLLTLHGVSRRQMGANPYTLHKAGRLDD